VQPGTWILEANSQWSGSIYQWLAGFFQGAGIRPSARRSVYDWMEAQAQGLPPGANDTFACLGPILMDAKLFHLVRPGVFLFPPPGHLMTESPVMPAHFIRATLENIAFAMRGNIELACGSQTSPLDGLFLTGGLAKSRLFCQILADCTGLVVRVGRESEGTALGAAVCAAAGIRAFPDMASAQKGLVHLDRLVEPSSENTELYQPAYERWRELYAKTEEL
jgi:sugar (pentulose or hexulose) kinase